MPARRRKSIYLALYTGFGAIFFLFFAHNTLEYITYDVLHINHSFCLNLFGLKFDVFVRDIFPMYNARGLGHEMDLQIYVYRLGSKIIQFSQMLMIVQLLRVLNYFLKEIPGRSCHRLIAYAWCFVGLFAYEIMDFIVFAGQTWWVWQSIGFFVVLSVTILTVKDR